MESIVDDNILIVDQVSKSYKEKKAVENVSFAVKQGEIFGIVGKNGAGKTTLLKMILGMISSDAGEIIVNYYNIKDSFEKAMQGVGGVIETPDLYQNLTGYQNLKLHEKIFGESNSEYIDEVIRYLKMESYIHRKVKKYSLGMKQRVALATALVHKPKLILLDEPTNGLDPFAIKELRELLRNLCDKHKVSIVFSSHLLSETEQLCDRVGIIQEGKLITVFSVRSLSKKLIHKKRTVHMQVECPEKIKKVAEQYELEVVFDKEKEEIIFDIENNKIPKLIKELANSDVEIYGVWSEKYTLEEYFIDILETS